MMQCACQLGAKEVVLNPRLLPTPPSGSSSMFYNRAEQRWEGGEEVDMSGFDADDDKPKKVRNDGRRNYDPLIN